MPAAAHILEVLGRVLGQGKEYEVAQLLLDFLSEHGETTYVNLQLVRQLTPGAGAGAHDSAIVRALQLLSGDAVRVLDVHFEIFDDDDHPHKLTNEEAKEALHHEVNPLTGTRDPEIRRRVAMYFAPTEEVMRSLNAGSDRSGASA